VYNFDLPGFLAAVMAAAPRRGDLLLTVGSPPQLVGDDGLQPLTVPGLERLSPFQTEAVVLHLLAMAPQTAATLVRDKGAAHFAYSVPGMNRFRASVFSQRGTFAVTLRTIPEAVPTLEELHLPEGVARACAERNGVVLVNGPAAAGRTTTLAAMVAEVNRTRRCHVVTVEDPIEFLHRHDLALVNQRQVGIDTPSLEQGLADALRQGADVLMVSEVRGPEEVRLLLEVAETGHLVMSTVRGVDTATSLSRFISLFAPEDRADARSRLARVLRWSFTQRLVPHRDGRRAVVEVWRATRTSVRHLTEGTIDSVTMADLLRDGEAEGQSGFDRELERRVRAGEIELDVALHNAVLPRQLELRLLDVGGAER
jgi:twitching motility protein PilT